MTEILNQGTRLPKNRRKIPPIPPHLSLYSIVVDQTPTNSTELLPWAAWYINKEVRGVKSTLTADAREEDLQKFIFFFYQNFPGGDIAKWDRAMTRSFLDFLQDNKYAVSSITRSRATLVGFASYLIRKSLLHPDDHPTQDVKPTISQSSSAPQSLQAEEDGQTALEGDEVFNLLIETLQAEIKNPKRHKRALPYRDISLLITLKKTGFRASEICRLTMEQRKSDPDTGGVVFMKVLCKGNKDRDIFMRDIGVSAMKAYIKNERGSLIDAKKKSLQKEAKSLSLLPDNIFLSYSGNPLSRVDIWRMVLSVARATINRIEKEQGITLSIKAHPHSFRHERAYDLLAAGLGEAWVAEEMGHSNLNYITRYTKRSDKERRRRLKNI